MAEERNRDADARDLLNAVHVGDKEKVVELLGHGVNVNVGGYGYVNGEYIFSYPLIEAAKLEPRGIFHRTIPVVNPRKIFIGMELIDLLLDNGARIDQTGSDHHSALSMASSIGNRGAVIKLLNRGANPNIGRTKPLIDAIRRNDFDLVRRLIEHRARLLDIRADNGDTPIKAAIETGNFEITNYLFQHATPEEKISMLRLALQNGKVDLIRYLVENGADLASLTTEERQQYAFLRRRHLLAGYGYARRSRKQRKASRRTRRRRT
jgi:hypothetical protein